MCCFSQPVDYVRATQIFARPSKAGQYVVYTMNFKAGNDLAMILPIPTPKDSKEDAVSFINLEKYPDLFDDLRHGFPEPRALGGARKDGPPPPAAAPPKLKVVEVGSFVASFVPTVKDFARLDEQFRLPDGTWDKLPAYKEYGFAVFKLKKGEQKVHPMAFDFPRADPRQLFFPTVHIHDGKVHDRANFDHVLYCQGADTGMRWQESPQPASFFVKKVDETKGVVDPKAHVYRKVILGAQKNEDTWV